MIALIYFIMEKLISYECCDDILNIIYDYSNINIKDNIFSYNCDYCNNSYSNEYVSFETCADNMLVIKLINRYNNFDWGICKICTYINQYYFIQCNSQLLINYLCCLNLYF